jgi:hypothetical protein
LTAPLSGPPPHTRAVALATRRRCPSPLGDIAPRVAERAKEVEREAQILRLIEEREREDAGEQAAAATPARGRR